MRPVAAPQLPPAIVAPEEPPSAQLEPEAEDMGDPPIFFVGARERGYANATTVAVFKQSPPGYDEGHVAIMLYEYSGAPENDLFITFASIEGELAPDAVFTIRGIDFREEELQLWYPDITLAFSHDGQGPIVTFSMQDISINPEDAATIEMTMSQATREEAALPEKIADTPHGFLVFY